MAAVTGLTAQKTLDLLKTNIVSGSLVGDELILQRRDGTLINVGSVRGTAGAAASEAEINAAVAAAMAEAPQGVMTHDTVGSSQLISANSGTWYTIGGLSITDTIENDRVYEVSGGAILTSTAPLIGIDVEIRAGATFSGGTPLARETNFIYDSGKGVGFNLSRKIKGATGSFVGAKTFLIGFRCSADSDVNITNDYADSHITLVDLGPV